MTKKINYDLKSSLYIAWKSCGSPDSGTVYDCYKSARKQYRTACRLAMTSRTTKTFALIERFARENKSNVECY